MGRRWVAFQLVSLVIAFVTGFAVWQPHVPWGAQLSLIVPFWIAITPLMIYRAFPSRAEQSTGPARLRMLPVFVIGMAFVQALHVWLVFLHIIEWETAWPVLGVCVAIQVAAYVWFVLRSRRQQPL